MSHTNQEIIELSFRKVDNTLSEVAIIDLDTFSKEAGHIASLPHRLKFYQILFITHGEGTHWVDFEPIPYCQGALFPIEKGRVQVYDLQPNTEGYLVLFTEEYLYRYATDLAWLFNLALFNPYLSPLVLYLPPEESAEFVELIKHMRTELSGNPDFAKDDILRNLLRVFILKAERVKRTQCNLMLPDSQKDYDLFIHFRNALDTDYSWSRGVEAHGLTDLTFDSYTPNL